jgi:hypothetical protein
MYHPIEYAIGVACIIAIIWAVREMGKTQL